MINVETHIDDDWELSQTTQDVVPNTCDKNIRLI